MLLVLVILDEPVRRNLICWLMACYCCYMHSLNLYELIKKNNYQGFSLNLIRRFAYSLIQCLRLLRRENIIHCDLKPVRYYTSPDMLCWISAIYD